MRDTIGLFSEILRPNFGVGGRRSAMGGGWRRSEGDERGRSDGREGGREGEETFEPSRGSNNRIQVYRLPRASLDQLLTLAHKRLRNGVIRKGCCCTGCDECLHSPPALPTGLCRRGRECSPLTFSHPLALSVTLTPHSLTHATPRHNNTIITTNDVNERVVCMSSTLAFVSYISSRSV